VLISRFFNHGARACAGRPQASVSEAYFFAARLSVNHKRCAQGCVNRGSILMTFGMRLSVATAYLAMAFVGAIILGVI
jgi:hypothetical protein